MRVLFLSVTAGQGHNATARAVMSYLLDQGVECTMLDTFRYINRVLSHSIDRGYVNMTRFTPEMWGKIYDAMDEAEDSKNLNTINTLISTLLSKKMITFIQHYRPDVVVCSHVFPALILNALKRQNALDFNFKSIGIVTDFTIHPFWEKTGLDYFVTASEMLEYLLTKKGIGREQILPFGIPVHPKFSAQPLSKAEARKALDIADKRTFLMMGGSMGFGNAVDVLKELDELNEDFQILMVCGSNKRLLNRVIKLSANTRHVIVPYGFTDQVEVMMDASDILLTKPGGLTTSEALCKGIPMVLLEPIPGLEDRNLIFLTNMGLAVRISERAPADEVVAQLLFNEMRLGMMRYAQQQFGKRDAARRLGEFILGLEKSRKEAKFPFAD